MSKKSKLKFECQECGSNQLAYQNYVKCITPVELKEDGFMEYGLSQFDESDFMCSDNDFICLDCKSDIEHCGFRLHARDVMMSRKYRLMVNPFSTPEYLYLSSLLAGQI